MQLEASRSWGCSVPRWALSVWKNRAVITSSSFCPLFEWLSWRCCTDFVHLLQWVHWDDVLVPGCQLWLWPQVMAPITAPSLHCPGVCWAPKPHAPAGCLSRWGHSGTPHLRRHPDLSWWHRVSWEKREPEDWGFSIINTVLHTCIKYVHVP